MDGWIYEFIKTVMTFSEGVDLFMINSRGLFTLIAYLAYLIGD